MATRTDGAGVGGALKRLLVGRALSTSAQEHQLLPKSLALPVFSSDTLSSVAYATEEMMLVFITAGVAALTYRIPVALAIVALLAIVVTSYRQTVKAYPRGGGSYIVARENLGTMPGLIAAAAILTDYVLTVAVSITAGTIAITSAAPSLAEHKVLIASGLVALVTAANLRGVKEAGALFALPTYGFVVDRGRHDRDWACGNASRSVTSRRPPISRWSRWRPCRCSCSCARSPPARPRSPASRRSPTACRRSAARRRRTPPRRSRSWGSSRAPCSSGSRCCRSSSTSGSPRRWRTPDPCSR